MRVPAVVRSMSSSRWALLWALGLASTGSTAAHAQFIGQYFPSGVPGYQNESGVTVASRQRLSYAPIGVRAGSFMIRPDLDEGTGYNSNVSGLANATGSWLLRTAPSVTIDSDWSRNRLGAAFTLDDTRYFSAPDQNYTDWTATVGGGYTIGRREAVLGYSHLSLHEDPTQIGSVRSSTPIPYSVDDLRASYTFDLGRLSFTPRVDVQLFQFGDATLLGVPVSQDNQNRVVTTGGVETRYALSEQRSLVFVVQGIDSRFINELPGQITQSSNSFVALSGIDYQATGPWRYRLLAGIENRSFSASQFSSRTAPVVEASVIWTPTGLTTVTGALSRTIEDPAAAGSGGYTYTRARLVVDHELRRNILLQGRLGFETAEYLQGGGTQSNVTLGAGAQYLLNRNVRVGIDYSFFDQSGSNVNNGFTNAGANAGAFGTFRGGSFNRSVILFGVRFSL